MIGADDAEGLRGVIEGRQWLPGHARTAGVRPLVASDSVVHEQTLMTIPSFLAILDRDCGIQLKCMRFVEEEREYQDRADGVQIDGVPARKMASESTYRSIGNSICFFCSTSGFGKAGPLLP